MIRDAKGPDYRLCEIPYTLIMCENDDEEILMIKRLKPPYVGQWNFLGGKIAPNETPLASACRELEEEFGLRRHPRFMKFCGIAAWPTDDNRSTCGMFLFRTKFRRKDFSFSQMSMLDEGFVSWKEKRLRDFDATLVPNYAPLLDLFEWGADHPSILMHEVSGQLIKTCEVYKMREDMFGIAATPTTGENWDLIELVKDDNMNELLPKIC